MARVETPMNVGFLDHGRQRLLGGPAGLQERRKVAARAQLRDAQFHVPGARLPVPVPVAVPLRLTIRALLAIAGTRLAANFELHQSLGGETDHLAQKFRVTALLHQLAQVHHGFGHRGHPSVQVGVRNPTLPRNPMTASATPRPGTRPGTVAVRILNWARDEGRIAVHYCDRLHRIYAVDRAEIVWLEADRAAFDAIAPLWVRRVLLLACETGLRPSDFVRLTRGNLEQHDGVGRFRSEHRNAAASHTSLSRPSFIACCCDAG